MSFEQSPNRPSASEKLRHGLIIEHARLAAHFGGESDNEVRESIFERLREIEEELEMTGAEIAKEALALYKAQY